MSDFQNRLFSQGNTASQIDPRSETEQNIRSNSGEEYTQETMRQLLNRYHNLSQLYLTEVYGQFRGDDPSAPEPDIYRSLFRTGTRGRETHDALYGTVENRPTDSRAGVYDTLRAGERTDSEVLQIIEAGEDRLFLMRSKGRLT